MTPVKRWAWRTLRVYAATRYGAWVKLRHAFDGCRVYSDDILELPLSAEPVTLVDWSRR